MSNPHPPEVIAQMEAAAIHQPHQLFVADRLLKLDVGPFTSSVTIGNSTPAGQIMPIATVTASTQVLRAFAEQIIAGIDANSEQIKAELAAFSAKLP